MAKDNLDIEGIVKCLLAAVHEVKAEGGFPETDPAVMLFGVRVAFMTHADMGTDQMYRQLIDLCEARAQSAVIETFGVRQ